MKKYKVEPHGKKVACSAGSRVNIFVLACHLGCGNCGGLGRGKICRGDGEWGRVEKTASTPTPPPFALCPNPLPVKHPITSQDGGVDNQVYRAFRSKITPALQARKKVEQGIKKMLF